MHLPSETTVQGPLVTRIPPPSSNAVGVEVGVAYSVGALVGAFVVGALVGALVVGSLVGVLVGAFVGVEVGVVYSVGALVGDLVVTALAWIPHTSVAMAPYEL